MSFTLISENFNINIMQFLKDFERYAILYNQDKYPNPTYLSMHSIVSKSSSKITWRGISRFMMTDPDPSLNTNSTGYIRVIYRPDFDVSTLPLDPSDKSFYTNFHFALEDTYILQEKVEYDQANKTSLKSEQIKTIKGSKKLIRNFLRDAPTKTEIDLMAHSHASFIAFCAKKQLIDDITDTQLDQKSKDILIKTLESIVNK
jgi:hypothetical protein